jgi:NAD(P)-dependent dehydrogenase (short-subunit alcohol dehydrogenase family)
MEKDFWDRVIGTNLGGTFNCTKHVLPTMEAQRSGHIVSTMGGTSAIGGSPYGVSKDAVLSFTRYVALEEREFDICVVSIGPGARIATEEAPDEARARMPGPESVGNRFVLAAQVGMEMSGHLLNLADDGTIVVATRRGE